MMNSILLSNIVLIGLVIGMVAGALVIFYQVYKNEKSRRKFLPNMKIGDEVHFSSVQIFEGVVSDMNPTENPDIVEVKLLIHKNSLYPVRVN